MNGCRDFVELTLAGAVLQARATGALFWPEQRLLCVSDLHLGKSDRIARRAGVMLPPYETRDALARLEADLRATGAKTVVLLGDTFDDMAAADSLDEEERLWILRLQAGRRWVWITGNHDPVPTEFAGAHRAELTEGGVTFRHIAVPGENDEISGHYHPKAVVQTRGRQVSRPCFLVDETRIVMPAYGTFTGGLRWSDPALMGLMRPGATAVLTGQTALRVPMPHASAGLDAGSAIGSA